MICLFCMMKDKEHEKVIHLLDGLRRRVPFHANRLQAVSATAEELAC
ncbi:MAG: hypothetical protein MZU97_25135 [Bacillus subtilis]|nr:hypothetical protein [Bacillus subtilis]